MEKSINVRYLSLIEYFTKGNKRQFSLKINVSPTVIDNIVGSRASSPSFGVIEKTISAFDDINPTWLITGKGNMILPKQKDDVSKKGRIWEYLSFRKLTEEQFYLKSGIAKGTLDTEEELSDKHTRYILMYYPDINPTWLTTGEGNMIVKGAEYNERIPNNSKQEEDLVNEPGTEYKKSKGYVSEELFIMQTEEYSRMIKALQEEIRKYSDRVDGLIGRL